jgi:site-specific recombinase XerC
MASIKKRPDGRWRARYRDPDGHERARHFDRKVDAERWLDQMRSQLVRGEYVDPAAGKVTFSDYVDEWLARKVGVSPRTRVNVEGRIANYARPFFGTMRLGAVRPMHADSFVAGLGVRGLAAATVKAIALTTGQVFESAVRDGIISRSPFDGVELPSERHHEEMRFLDADQLNALAAAIERRYVAAIYLAAYGGLRAGELWGLRIERVNVLAATVDIVESLSEVRGHLTVGPTKTGKRRAITVPRFLADMTGEHIGAYADGYVFTAAMGGPVRHRNFSRRHFEPAVAAAGLGPLRFHDLRHTCAALLVANGRHLEEVKDYLGHSSIRVTSDRYGHLFPRARAELADALDATYRSAAPAPADSSRTGGALADLAERHVLRKRASDLRYR